MYFRAGGLGNVVGVVQANLANYSVVTAHPLQEQIGDLLRSPTSDVHIGKLNCAKTNVVDYHVCNGTVSALDDSPVRGKRSSSDKIVSYLRSKRFDFISVSDYSLGAMTSEVVRAIKDQVEKRNAICIVDCRKANFMDYFGCQVFLPNSEEFSAFWKRSEASEARMSEMREQLNAQKIILKKGADGVCALLEDKILNVRPGNVTPRDTFGAGDYFQGFLLNEIMQNGWNECSIDAAVRSVEGKITTIGGGALVSALTGNLSLSA